MFFKTSIAGFIDKVSALCKCSCIICRQFAALSYHLDYLLPVKMKVTIDKWSCFATMYRLKGHVGKFDQSHSQTLSNSLMKDKDDPG